MTVIDKLASSLGRRDEVPNQILAKQIAAKSDKKAVSELVENLSNKNKNIQSDCIKTLYEIGVLKPKLISTYAKDFIVLLDNKNNRLQWGAMTALSSIVAETPEVVYASLPKILSSADKGSVITKDHCVSILVSLCSEKKYIAKALPLLFEQILQSPDNQFPTYAEKTMPLIDEKHKKQFLKILTSRFGQIETETKKKRVEKLIKKLS